MDMIAEILDELHEHNIRLSVAGDDILVHVNGVPLDSKLKEKIRTIKPALIEHLNSTSNNTANLADPDVAQSSSAINRLDYEPYSVIDFIEQQCSARPESTAITCNNQSINYRTLNTQVSALANRLAQYEIKHGDVVAVFMGRSISLVAAVLAIFKAGAVYLPIDPAIPKERIHFLLEDADAKAVFVDALLQDRLPGTPALVICADSESHEISMDVKCQAGEIESSDTACIIYTSGSTGKPKGVELSHRSLTNIMLQVIEMLELNDADTILAITSIGFDISLFELLALLTVGGKIVLLDRDDSKDPARIAAAVVEHKITVLQATPSMWKFLNQYDWSTPARRIQAISTGEPLPKDLAWGILERCPVLWNLYGPTETTIWATGKKLVHKTEDCGNGNFVSIGRPIVNYTTCILDNSRNPVPAGVIGELYIGGTGLARKYLHNQPLTDEKFIRDPFQTGSNEIFYKTGDLVRLLPNKDIEYIGRNDHQVKINGNRVELGEIETVLKTHGSVHDVIVNPVTLDGNGRKMLVAYIVSEPGTYNKTSESFNRFLARVLPAYMLPQRYMFLDKLPLTVSGKIDRQALPLPELYDDSHSFVAPRDELENTLAEIFCDVLGIEKISIFDSFFDAGGSSMLVAALLIPINHRFNLKLTLRNLLRIPPTVSNVAALIRERGYFSE